MIPAFFDPAVLIPEFLANPAVPAVSIPVILAIPVVPAVPIPAVIGVIVIPAVSVAPIPAIFVSTHNSSGFSDSSSSMQFWNCKNS